MAGALLFEKIMQICQEKYGCCRDADFPYAFLMNYPFEEMLTEGKNERLLEKQLEECFGCFLNNGVSVAAIACNTLHAFLPSIPRHIHLIHMIEETAVFIREKGWKRPLILCTSTSAEARLHERFFPCRYPDPSLQAEIDTLIDRILAEECLKKCAGRLNSLCGDETIVLGCTELSLLNERAKLNFKNLCDPNTLVADQICHLIFGPCKD